MGNWTQPIRHRVPPQISHQGTSIGGLYCRVYHSRRWQCHQQERAVDNPDWWFINSKERGSRNHHSHPQWRNAQVRSQKTVEKRWILKTPKTKTNKKKEKEKSKIEHNLYLCHKKKGKKKGIPQKSIESSTTECTGLKKIAEIGWRRRSSEKWLEVGESDGESEKKGSLKIKAQKLKFSRKPKSHTIGALTPLVRTHHVAMMCVAPPPIIKCGVKSQEPCPIRKPFIFWWSSWHITTTIEPGGQLMGLMNSPSLDDLIKYTCPSWHDTDEHRRTINKSIQCRE